MSVAEGFASRPSFWCVIHEGEPIVKSRARVVRNGSRSYTPDKTRHAQAALAMTLRRSIPRFTGNVVIVCIFRRPNRQRCDVDNLLKLVLDAGTQAGLWEDDSQVTALVGILEHDPDDPRSTICFSHHESSMRRGEDAKPRCVVCGKPYDDYGNPSRQHCSRECRMTLAEPVPCPNCGQPFKRANGNRKFCSVACRAEASRVARPCERCGAPRARPESTLCRDCFRAGCSESEKTIQQLWLAGVPAAEIGVRLGISAGLVGSRISGMRKRGYDLPYRHPSKARAEIEITPL